MHHFWRVIQLKSIYYSFNENYHLGNRLEATQEELLKRLSSRVGQEARTDRVQKAVQDLPAQELNALYGDHPRNFVDGDKELLFLCKQYVTKEFMKIKRTIVKKRFLNVNAQYVHFLRHVPSLLDLSKLNDAPFLAGHSTLTISSVVNHDIKNGMRKLRGTPTRRSGFKAKHNVPEQKENNVPYAILKRADKAVEEYIETYTCKKDSKVLFKPCQDEVKEYRSRVIRAYLKQLEYDC